MKYLIVGLGNIGLEYENTRHNIGFMTLDFLAQKMQCTFESNRYAFTANFRHKGKAIWLAKPTTYMNLSGKAVNYWMNKENIPLENILIIADDIALPLGKLRMRAKGSDAGHNGIANIIEILGTNLFHRLRFGIGDTFSKGYMVDFVLGKWSSEEMGILKPKIELAAEMIISFAIAGAQNTMNRYNNL